MTSYIERASHEFACSNPKCGKTFQESYRRLLESDVIRCPACETTIDIRESKRSREANSVGSWLNAVAEIEKQHREKK